MLLSNRTPLSVEGYIFLGFFLVVYAFIFFDYLYGMYRKKPLYVHFYIFLNKLSPREKSIVSQHSVFYKKLTPKQQKYFEHRIKFFLTTYNFKGGNNFEITDEVKVTIAATYVQLTFGMRDYLIESFEHIVVYPSVYFSNPAQNWHKGEFNPRVRTIVFSWEDFKEGFETISDNLNLGFHEFSHAIHHYFFTFRKDNLTSYIFKEYFRLIITYLKSNENHILEDQFFRSYAYSNQFEFVAVLLEHFFENPLALREKHPELFHNTLRMLNYNVKYI